MSQPKKQLITLGQDGELALKLPDGGTQRLSIYNHFQNAFVYLVIDCSGSMTGKKIVQAKNGALDFARTAFSQGYAVGLISFSDDFFHLCSPTNNFEELNLAVNKLKIQGGTTMAPAIEEATSRLKPKADALLAMVIVTDGQTSDPAVTLRVAEKAKQSGISILTIGTDDADYIFLSKLASETKLAQKVSNSYLEKAISDVAKLLPKG